MNIYLTNKCVYGEIMYIVHIYIRVVREFSINTRRGLALIMRASFEVGESIKRTSDHLARVC